MLYKGNMTLFQVILFFRTLASGVDTPGSIRIYKRDGSWARTKAFKPAVSCVKLSKEPAYGIYGDRVITLGLNLYADDDGKSRGVSVDNRPQKEGNMITQFSAT